MALPTTSTQLDVTIPQRGGPAVTITLNLIDQASATALQEALRNLPSAPLAIPTVGPQSTVTYTP